MNCFEALSQYFVTRLYVSDKQYVSGPVCLCDNVVRLHTIAEYALRTLAFVTDARQLVALGFYDVPRRAKFARSRDAHLGFTEWCVKSHSHKRRTTAVRALKTFHGAQLAFSVGPAIGNNHIFICYVHGGLLSNVGLSVKSAHTSSQLGSHLKWNEVFRRLYLLLCVPKISIHEKCDK